MKFLIVVSHGLTLVFGFALGLYALPILTAPEAPSVADVVSVSEGALFTADLHKDLAGSDFFHWGEGRLSVTRDAISLMGKLAPGPDYRLYLAPSFVDDEAGFLAIKARSLDVGPVKTFDNFIVPLDEELDFSAYNTVVIWCESFGEFISAGRYR